MKEPYLHLVTLTSAPIQTLHFKDLALDYSRTIDR